MFEKIKKQHHYDTELTTAQLRAQKKRARQELRRASRKQKLILTAYDTTESIMVQD